MISANHPFGSPGPSSVPWQNVTDTAAKGTPVVLRRCIESRQLGRPGRLYRALFCGILKPTMGTSPFAPMLMTPLARRWPRHGEVILSLDEQETVMPRHPRYFPPSAYGSGPTGAGDGTNR